MPSAYWKRVNCIMRVCIRCQNANLTTAAQCSVNILKTVRFDLDICDWDHDAMAVRKGKNGHSGCIHSPEFILTHLNRALAPIWIAIWICCRQGCCPSLDGKHCRCKAVCVAVGFSSLPILPERIRSGYQRIFMIQSASSTGLLFSLTVVSRITVINM